MKIVLMGNVANYAYNVAGFLRRAGFDAHLLLLPYELGVSPGDHQVQQWWF